MAIKKSSDGYYRTTVRYNGKAYSIAGKTEAEAIRKSGALRAKLENGIQKKPKAKTVSAFAEEWLETYRASGTENDTRYRQLLYNIVIPAIGHRNIDTITEADLQRLLNENSHYSKSQLSKLRMALKQLFKKARKNHLILDDPAEDLALPNCSFGTHRAITEEERRRILALAENHRSGLYIKLMLYCGLRCGEVDALQWRYVDLNNRVIHVRQAVKHGTTTIGAPKSKAGVRDVPIPNALYEALVEESASDPDAFVCTNVNGGMHTSASRNRMWNSFKRQLDIDGGATVYRNRIVESTVEKDLTLYCLRHTYCTDLQRAGVPLNIAKTLMGHEDISVTANIYAHVTSEDAQRAVETLDEYIMNSQNEEDERIAHNVIKVNFRKTEAI